MKLKKALWVLLFGLLIVVVILTAIMLSPKESKADNINNTNLEKINMALSVIENGQFVSSSIQEDTGMIAFKSPINFFIEDRETITLNSPVDFFVTFSIDNANEACSYHYSGIHNDIKFKTSVSQLIHIPSNPQSKFNSQLDMVVTCPVMRDAFIDKMLIINILPPNDICISRDIYTPSPISKYKKTRTQHINHK